LSYTHVTAIAIMGLGQCSLRGNLSSKSARDRATSNQRLPLGDAAVRHSRNEAAGNIGVMTTPTTIPPLAGGIAGSVDSSFVIAEWDDPGGRPDAPMPIAPWHVHHDDDEAWYVLEGILQVKTDTGIIEARSGSCVFVPRGTPHTYWNAGPGLLRYLLIMTPSVHALIAEIHATADRSHAVMKALFKKYDSELLE
jgi:mannose-6-phosphate isomerase-like protein (cupin superfamily)